MTLSEVLDRFEVAFGKSQGVDAQWIELFVSLGMLKLDEPGIEGRGTVFKTRSLLRDLNLGHMSPAQFDNALIRAGLEIVEAE